MAELAPTLRRRDGRRSRSGSSCRRAADDERAGSAPCAGRRPASVDAAAPDGRPASWPLGVRPAGPTSCAGPPRPSSQPRPSSRPADLTSVRPVVPSLDEHLPARRRASRRAGTRRRRPTTAGPRSADGSAPRRRDRSTTSRRGRTARADRRRPRPARSRGPAGWSSPPRSSPITCCRPVRRPADRRSGWRRRYRSTSLPTRSATAAAGVSGAAGDLRRPVLARPEVGRPDHAALRVGVPRRSSRRCSAWPSRSTRSTASAPRGRCRGSSSQPIHRDDVINGKFAAGLAVIGARRSSAVRRRHRRLRLCSGSGSCPAASRGRCGSCSGSLVTFVYVGALAGVRDAAVGRRARGRRRRR